ncbi:MAG: sugar transferase [Chloroflexi bacterium]|nr:sugar transferase [Chloroflexota bacterium]
MGKTIQLGIKRAFDVVVSIAALVVLSPLIALIAIAIKRDSPGSIFFVQERVGKDGKPFRAIKFRTMIVNAEKIGLGLEIAHDDARITRVGHVLRRWTLDEIPQLFNVLRNEMSVIGPRPTVQSQVERYTPWQRRRLTMKPGMAGWAWIHGRNNLAWSRRIELDVWYVEHWSLWLDVKIFFIAVLILFRHEGVYGTDGIARDFE